MPDFAPLCEIVTVGYQLDDETHAHTNNPFTDRKLSWKAAILSQHALQRNGWGGMGWMMAESVRWFNRLGDILDSC